MDMERKLKVGWHRWCHGALRQPSWAVRMESESISSVMDKSDTTKNLSKSIERLMYIQHVSKVLATSHTPPTLRISLRTPYR